VLTSIKADKDQANDGLSSALLILYLDSARNLPVSSVLMDTLLSGVSLAYFQHVLLGSLAHCFTNTHYAMFSILSLVSKRVM